MPTEINNPQGFDYSSYRDVSISGLFLPSLSDKEFRDLHAKVPPHSPIGLEAYYTLYVMAQQALWLDQGIFMECGVFRGGSAGFLARVIDGSRRELHLFDTFEGMPETNSARDPLHVKGDFNDTSLEEVRATVGHAEFVTFHKGTMPETFAGMESARIAFAHVDVDIYQSAKDCCEFIYPRLVPGGIMVFDDYGHCTCVGAQMAITEYFIGKPSYPLPVLTGQCVVVKP